MTLQPNTIRQCESVSTSPCHLTEKPPLSVSSTISAPVRCATAPWLVILTLAMFAPVVLPFWLTTMLADEWLLALLDDDRPSMPFV